ncbi:class I SAM-dependent methyltransferase [Amycolatopsis cihanbeyliensis]|uniref:Methyltransferase family protein n=1 Tax=Amycolatopsis cihanbeyliensis TaxID=1128664 RepID=A0A542DCF6_AMYCI|nr:class I SAM-dependent methyltransferase [Amycolatopsis cihanbeyliensis]TQJ00735.1 methyltransferase family protein [Amycolatopsis cihanbeyliensis]
MGLGFSGDVVDFYHRYRRGYPAAVFDTLADEFRLSTADLAADLGCGTGQLTCSLATRVAGVIGVDPEPDMLARARRAATERGIGNIGWLLGADTDLPALRALLGSRRLGCVTIGQALHWMDHERLFPELAGMVRPGGGVAVLTNGTPLWLQSSSWSRALRDCLERLLDTELTRTCGTDEPSQRGYRDAMVAAGLTVRDARVDYHAELDPEQIVGGVYSAMAADQLPSPARRPEFTRRIERALRPYAPFVEQVEVRLLLGRTRSGDV